MLHERTEALDAGPPLPKEAMGPTPKCGHTHAGGFAGHEDANRHGTDTPPCSPTHEALPVRSQTTSDHVGRPKARHVHDAHGQLGPAPQARIAPLALDLADFRVALVALYHDRVLALCSRGKRTLGGQSGGSTGGAAALRHSGWGRNRGARELGVLTAGKAEGVVASGVGACEGWADDGEEEDDKVEAEQSVEDLHGRRVHREKGWVVTGERRGNGRAADARPDGRRQTRAMAYLDVVERVLEHRVAIMAVWDGPRERGGDERHQADEVVLHKGGKVVAVA
eukprot:7391546-Prymnesium_polylepis.3